MRVFWDCEFSGLRSDTTLISIGCVSDSGQQFYGELEDYDKTHIDAWLRAHVLSHLWVMRPDIMPPPHIDYVVDHTPEVARRLAAWLMRVAPHERIEMWGDVLAYDWVLFCKLFGGPLNLPINIYYIPFDLATLLKIESIDPDINREDFAGIIYNGNLAKHNALWDAQVIRACYHKLMAHDFDKDRRSL